MTPPPAQSQEMIRRVVAALRAGRVPAPEDAAWVADGLDFLLDAGSRGGTFARAFCLDGAVDFLSKRDRLFIEIAATFYPDLQPSSVAKEIRSEWAQYARALLKRDLDCGQCSEPTGTLRSKLFELAQLNQEVPGQRRIRDILFEAAEQGVDFIGLDRKPACADFR